MSTSSDSDEFYDAEDNTPSRKPRKASKDSLTKRANSEPNLTEGNAKQQGLKSGADDDNNVFTEPPPIGSTTAIGKKKRFQELRLKLQTDDEDCPAAGNVTPPNSQTSSVEGVFATSTRSTHPFRVVEQDTISLQSLNSLVRVRRILTGAAAPDVGRKALSVSALSSSSLDSESTQSSKHTSQFPSTMTLATAGSAPAAGNESSAECACAALQEPDVIASTKVSAMACQKQSPTTDTSVNSTATTTTTSTTNTTSSNSNLVDVPVAPPRRKKKNKDTYLALTKSASSATFANCDLASPASTIDSIFSKEFEHSLDRLPAQKSQRSTSSAQADTSAAASSSGESKSSTLKSGHSLDITQALKGNFVVRPHDNDSLRAEDAAKAMNSKSPTIEVAECSVAAPVNPKEPTPPISSTNSPRGTQRSSVGHYSLGPHRGTHQNIKNSSKERRKSAGDENFLKGIHLHVRTRTDSGKHLSDMEILEQVTVLNLDTGERIPLSVAEDKLPQGINPLSLHIMRLTSEYVSSSSVEKENDSDEESVDNKKIEIPIVDGPDSELGRMRKKTQKIKQFLGSTVKKTMHKAKSISAHVTHARHKEDTIDIVDNVHPGEQNCKLKASNSHKGPYEFEKIEHVQELKDDHHEGPIWCMKFSVCGRLLATAGQDKVLRIWIVKDAYPFFQDMRTKYNAEKVSPTPSQESLVSHHSLEAANVAAFENMTQEEAGKLTFMPKPFCTYFGHTSDLLDVSWSKNYFILSSSMDKTVRLWHISRKECLCCFQHIDFVTAIVFHPRDDRYFLSGSLDGKLRLWNIPDKKVAVWNEVEGTTKLITAANFCQNGKFAVVGTYDGRCIFYITDQLKYHTQLHVRSSRGRNATGRKISGIEPMPGEDKILVTSNDSRIRLYDLRDLNVSCKYKGYVNTSSQIKASFSHDGKYIVSGSENRDIYIWKTNHDYSKFASVRRDRNDFWEAIKAHNAVVTCAIFAPTPEVLIRMVEENNRDRTDGSSNKVEDPVVEQHKGCGGYVLISADFNGIIKVFMNKTKPKHSSLPVSAMA